MDLTNLLYIKYLLFFVAGVIVGRITMALQYAFVTKKVNDVRAEKGKKRK